jgi:hypothetical protein
MTSKTLPKGICMTLRNLGLALLLLPLLLAAAPADRGADIKQQHRAAAEKYFSSLKSGVHLTGTVNENGSMGRFDAYFLDGVWAVRQQFGDLNSLSYDGPEGSWTSSNYGLPYMFEPEDNPASTTLGLLTGGEYLDEPNWSNFIYIDDVAGGYNFRFAPPGLPAAQVVLYADSADPQYLQIMSVEIRLSEHDADSNTYRSFYYYATDDKGNIHTERETGREIDSTGETSSFSEYTVERTAPITALPAEAQFSFARTPVGGLSSQLTAPVEVPVDVGNGYFIVPVTFAGSDQTWNFIFDSGASASLFTPEAAAAAGLVPSINVPAHGHGSRVDFQMGLCTTASIGRVDAPAEQRAPLAGFPAARVSENNTDVLAAFRQYKAGGIMGVSMLHQYVATFDHLGGKLTLIPPHLFNAKNDVPVPNVEFWIDVEDLLYLTAYMSDGVQPEKLKGEVVLDTGLQQQLAVLRETTDHAGLALTKVDSRKNTVLGGIKSFDYVTVPSFELGPLSWQDVEASMTDDDKGTLSARGVLGFVGVPLFFGTRVTIDAFAQRMYIRPLDEAEMKAMLEQLQGGIPGDAISNEGGGGDTPTADDTDAAAENSDDDDAEDDGELPVDIRHA